MRTYIKYLAFAAILLVLLAQTCVQAQELKQLPHARIVGIALDPEVFEVDNAPQPLDGLENAARRIKYPDLLKKIGLEGRVLAGACIDSQGVPSKVFIWYSDAEPFSDAATEAIRQVRFKPATWEGHPVDSKIVIPIVFSLKQELDYWGNQRPEIAELVLDRSPGFHPKYVYRVWLTREGIARRVHHKPEASDAGSRVKYVPDPDSTVGFFNSEELDYLRVLLDKLHFPDSTSVPWSMPSGNPKETLTLIFANGTRATITSYHEDPIAWAVLAAVEHIVSGIRWSGTWRPIWDWR